MRHEALLSRGAGRFVRLLLGHLGTDWLVERAGERPWASATFEGLRVRVALRRAANGAPVPPALLCDRIEQADYGVGRYLVADVSAAGAADVLNVEALLIEQA